MSPTPLRTEYCALFQGNGEGCSSLLPYECFLVELRIIEVWITSARSSYPAWSVPAPYLST